MKNKYEAGMRSQREAEEFLLSKNYRILERNYRIRTGEIDLIARDGDFIVFVEVKYRSGLKFGLPRESVNFAKQQKIIRTALHYISTKKLDNHDFRFDVIEVIEQAESTTINHIENAFGA